MQCGAVPRIEYEKNVASLIRHAYVCPVYFHGRFSLTGRFPALSLWHRLSTADMFEVTRYGLQCAVQPIERCIQMASSTNKTCFRLRT